MVETVRHHCVRCSSIFGGTLCATERHVRQTALCREDTRLDPMDSHVAAAFINSQSNNEDLQASQWSWQPGILACTPVAALVDPEVHREICAMLRCTLYKKRYEGRLG